MFTQEEILAKIKSVVLEEIPDAKVYLFGSRVTGRIHDESDWDILVITSAIVNRALRKNVHYKLFPFNLQIDGFIETTIVNEREWQENPSYYVLSNSIKNEKLSL